jgi:hypothetical protein
MSEYKSGYGQARADALQLVTDAIATIDRSCVIDVRPLDNWPVPTDEQRALLKKRREALIWVRSLVKSLKVKSETGAG